MPSKQEYSGPLRGVNEGDAIPIFGETRVVASDPMSRSIHVTVAAIAEDGGRFLLVAERINGELVVNQPAGHWEPGETLIQAVARETLEETGWEFEPRNLVGVYQWEHPNGIDVFLRFAIHGAAVREVPGRELDSEIEEVLWWSEADLRAASIPHRSPQVLRCIEDFRQGHRYTLNCLKQIIPG